MLVELLSLQGSSDLQKMGQSIGTLFGGNLNVLGLGNSITADEVTKNLNLEDYTAIVTGMRFCNSDAFAAFSCLLKLAWK